MLFAIGFVTMFVIGGINGVFQAPIPLDYPLQDTYWVVAHLHYVLFGGTILGVFAGFYFWFPRMSRRMYSERLARWHFAFTLIGMNLVFFTMHFLRLEGQARRRLVVAAFEGGPGLLQRLPDLAHVPSDVAGPLRGLQGLRHVLERIGPRDSRLRLTRLLFENLVPQRLHWVGRGRRGGLGLRRSGRTHLGGRGRRRGFRLRGVGHVDPARLERRGDVLLRPEKGLLLHRELLAFRGEVVQFILERRLQFDERVVLRRGLLLAGVHLFANLQHLPLAGFERIEPLVLELDEFLFALRELPVALGHAALHHGEPIDRLCERALALCGQLLALDERLDLPFGLFQMIRELVLEALHLILAVLDRLLPVVQRASPVLDASLLGGCLVPFHPHAGDILVHR